MPPGTVKWFSGTKDYRFIAPEDGSKDVFVHVSAVERAGLGTLRENQRVNFKVRPGRDGRTSAENISLAVGSLHPPPTPVAKGTTRANQAENG